MRDNVTLEKNQRVKTSAAAAAAIAATATAWLLTPPAAATLFPTPLLQATRKYEEVRKHKDAVEADNHELRDKYSQKAS